MAQLPFQILSLDGGGIRGVFSAALLAAIEEDHGTSITDHFDLIAGTSTGGIIAIGLGLGLRPREILEFYVEHGPRIFRNRLRWRDGLHWIARKYADTQLAISLKAVFGGRLFGESAKRLVVPSFNLTDNDVYIFRTPHLEDLRRDYRVTAWQVALATAAAPTFFPACRHVDSLRLVDGGVWANNPAMVALVEAVGPLCVPLTSVGLLSVGSVAPLRRYRGWLDTGGRLLWAGSAPELIMDATSIGVQNQVELFLSPDRYMRANALAPNDALSLDRVKSSTELIARARHVSRKLMPHIAKAFLQHRAAPYKPHYGPAA